MRALGHWLSILCEVTLSLGQFMCHRKIYYVVRKFPHKTGIHVHFSSIDAWRLSVTHMLIVKRLNKAIYEPGTTMQILWNGFVSCKMHAIVWAVCITKVWFTKLRPFVSMYIWSQVNWSPLQDHIGYLVEAFHLFHFCHVLLKSLSEKGLCCHCQI